MAEIGFGAFVPQGWKMDLVGAGDSGPEQWARAKGVAQAAEAAGYDSIWVYDHFHNVPVPAGESVFECWTTLAALAEATERVRLGQMVSATPYRNPALTAKITSSLDVISGGRLEWGVGAAWYEQEFNAYGYEFAAAKDRIGALAEAVEIVRSMWTEPETSFEGRYYRVAGAQCDPKPVQQPHPPIWIGGGGEQLTLRVVARLADRSNFGGKPHEYAHKCEVLKEHCAAVGRDYDGIDKTWSPACIVREDEDEIRAMVEEHRAGLVFEDYDSFQAGNLVGTPEQVAEQVRRYVDMGCSYFVPFFNDYPSTESLELFATRVMPEFR